MKLYPTEHIQKVVEAQHPGWVVIGLAASPSGCLTFPLTDLKNYRAQGKTQAHLVLSQAKGSYFPIVTYKLDTLEVEGAPASSVEWYGADEARTWPDGTLVLAACRVEADRERDHISTVILGSGRDSFTGENFTVPQHIDAIVAEYLYTHFATLPPRLPSLTP